MRFSVLATTGLFSLVLGAQGALAVMVPDGAETTISIVLAAPDRAGLNALAAATGISHNERMARFAALQPTQAQRASVITSVTNLGFDVTEVSTWTITARAHATRVASQFGVPRVSSRLTTAATSLPVKPADLNGLVSAVFLTNSSAKLHHRRALPPGPTGAQLRTSYSAPAGNAPAGKGGQTVATLQFSGWDPSDLTAYAAAAGVPDPVASGQYTGVSVGRATTRSAASDGDGDSEVALDQEALLAVAPNLRQRAYFAPNSSLSGEVNAMHQIASDASANKIVALSVSWGICEDSYFNSDGSVDSSSLNSELDAYASVLAAGVTIFASSGDAGAYDCSSSGETDAAKASKLAIDTPGAFPSVISVGGTSLKLGDPSTNTDDIETAWSDKAAPTDAPYRGDGGGGGRSRLVSRPNFQSSLASSFSGTDRLVPDISALAAPADGLPVYWARGGSNPWSRAGGTSLASPLSAGMFANILAESGASAGIGDIHSFLYTNPTYSGAGQTLRDITSGDNSFGNDSSHAAKAGFDLSTGLGSPIWSGIASRINGGGGPTPVDTTAPTLSLTASLSTPTSSTVSARWTGSDAGSGIDHYQVSITNSGSAPVVTIPSTTATSTTVSGVGGLTYTVTVTAFDVAGNQSSATKKVDVPVDDKSFAFSGSWKRLSNGSDFAGSANSSSTKSSTATKSLGFKSASALFNFAPTGGRVDVLVDGRVVKTIDTFSSSTRFRVPVSFASFASAGPHTVVFRIRGDKSAASRGTTVIVDALVGSS